MKRQANYTYATRFGCSFLVYQFEVMTTQAGEAQPSQRPRQKRTMAMPVKLRVAPMHISQAPHRKTVIPTTLVTGKRLKK